LNRFTFHFLDYIRYTLPRLPHDHFLSALAGLYFSPGKGLFLYSPILVLALISPFLKRKMERWDWFIYMGALLALSSVQALIYDDQWWSISWGTRALLPALPLAYLAVLPALGVVIDSKRNIIHFFTALLMILSVLIQISRLLTSDAVYVNWVVQFTGKSINADMLWDLRLAPLFQHWRLAFTNQNSDIAWLFINKQSMMLFPLLILFMLISLVYISILVIKRKNNPIKTSIIKFLLTTALILSPIATQFDQRYNKDVVVFNEVSDQICQETQKDDLVLIDAYLTPFWWFYSNFGCYKSDWVGLPYIHQTAIHSELYYPRFPDLERIVQNTLINGKQVFLIQFPQENVLLYSEEFNKAGYPIDLTTTYENPNTQVFVFRH
ncbi:MAG: hypothetical protein N2D54_13335, partial [Chloroflexota bacterium]